jgi:hypothetical protein
MNPETDTTTRGNAPSTFERTSRMTSPMSRRLRSTATVLAIAAATFAASLAVAWPKTTLADGDDADGEWTADGMKFGDVLVKTELVRDTKSKTGWVMVVTAKNDSDAPAKCKLEEDVTRSFSSPGARVSAPAVAIWKVRDTLALDAHASVTKKLDVPANIAAQMTVAERDQANRTKLQDKAQANDKDVPWRLVYAPINVFGTEIRRQAV